MCLELSCAKLARYLGPALRLASRYVELGHGQVYIRVIRPTELIGLLILEQLETTQFHLRYTVTSDPHLGRLHTDLVCAHH